MTGGVENNGNATKIVCSLLIGWFQCVHILTSSQTTIAQILCLCQKLARVILLWMVGCGETCDCSQPGVRPKHFEITGCVPPRQVLNSEQASQQMKMSRFLILSPIPHSLPSLHLQFSHPQSSSLGRGSAQELRQQGRSETSKDDGCPAMLPTCGLWIWSWKESC